MEANDVRNVNATKKVHVKEETRKYLQMENGSRNVGIARDLSHRKAFLTSRNLIEAHLGKIF